jgi:GABA(A) receptor-associated protein
MIKFDFKDKHTYEKRKDESDKIRAKYPDRVPIVCEVSHKDRNTLILDRSKYLVPKDITICQFMHVIRKRIKLSPENALYIFNENSELPLSSELIGNYYYKYQNLDGFLYFSISLENTFG